MSDRDQRHSTKAALICLFVAMIVAVLPASVTSPARGLVRLAFVPALRLVGDFRSQADSAFSSHEAIRLKKENGQLSKRLREAELRNRRTQLGILAAQDQIAQLKQTGASPFVASPASPLVTPQAVSARLIGDEIVSLWKSSRLLDRGSKSGLYKDQWVLDGEVPKIDHGQTSNIVDGLPVFAGRCLVGRIAKSGRWTSWLQLTSDPEFRTKAVVLLKNPGVLSAEFLLEGAGGGTCRLVSVPSSEHIEAGALVYSVPGDRGIDSPMLFGRVSKATLQPGSLHWEINVTPAVDLESLDSVQVVTTRLNPDRMIGRRDEAAPQTARAEGSTNR
ncbi:MAG: rod shape-determining protein MreC [Planctomycetes bacterium]|nr:rod shape-determining protein MreC [Planctomycetota bacterium]